MKKESNDEIQSEFIFGIHAVQEILKAPDASERVNKIFIQKDLRSEQLSRVFNSAKKNGLVIQEVPKTKLDTLSDNGNHQGVMASISAYQYAELDDIYALAESKNEDLFILILDSIEDPHNLGSILRTADAVGVHGVVIPKHRATGLTSVVAKTSTGAIEHVPVVRATNLVNTIKKLKEEKNMWFFGTDMDGEEFTNWNAKGNIGLVIGNEGKGIAPVVKKQMDQMLTIPMVGHVQSLNASVAAGVLMYQAFSSRKG
ncbi:23S rRNA (guanosine(2251)-2'-O)-methyltransferase RlmB [Companilactobacillus sp. RD055328]|uniref:23S rRNA (guanosine(2251)-2'-O)-methyltransferase RlmB n=1 Tax=Companilactobacillus sp. RD055328 TaxID=2916634 RepID=UPI001FC85774|nr:23S rRNA (guanosine(2251)-2'-O)-methyltransferase RlmB [Companilactobacillus sp. RD055328]GKQ42172.1 23S rRNA (guanosine(2251)-2'-O)-methyltransferase RlmB [Companilactobacillus sp. RD055328]